MIFLAIYFILLLVPSKNKLQQRQYFPQHSHALNIQCAFLIRRKIQGIKLFAKNLEVPCLRLPLTFGQPINWMNFGNVTHMQILWSYLLQRGNNFSKHCSRIKKKKKVQSINFKLFASHPYNVRENSWEFLPSKQQVQGLVNTLPEPRMALSCPGLFCSVSELLRHKCASLWRQIVLFSRKRICIFETIKFYRLKKIFFYPHVQINSEGERKTIFHRSYLYISPK